MRAYEIIASGLALIAIGISVYNLIAQRRLQRTTSELARKQLERIESEDAERLKAHIKLALVMESPKSVKSSSAIRVQLMRGTSILNSCSMIQRRAHCRPMNARKNFRLRSSRLAVRSP